MFVIASGGQTIRQRVFFDLNFPFLFESVKSINHDLHLHRQVLRRLTIQVEKGMIQLQAKIKNKKDKEESKPEKRQAMEQ